MATTKEGAVKAKVKSMLDSYGCYHFSPMTHGYGNSGIPDIVACCNGRFIAVECKAGRGKTTALQDRELTRINTAGGVALVINEHNLGDLAAYLTMLSIK